MMRPLLALALPARTARSVVKAASGRWSLAMRCAAADGAGFCSPRFAWRAACELPVLRTVLRLPSGPLRS